MFDLAKTWSLQQSPKTYRMWSASALSLWALGEQARLGWSWAWLWLGLHPKQRNPAERSLWISCDPSIGEAEQVSSRSWLFWQSYISLTLAPADTVTAWRLIMAGASHPHSTSINLNRAEQWRDLAQLPNSPWHLLAGRIPGSQPPGLQHRTKAGVFSVRLDHPRC